MPGLLFGTILFSSGDWPITSVKNIGTNQPLYSKLVLSFFVVA